MIVALLLAPLLLETAPGPSAATAAAEACLRANAPRAAAAQPGLEQAASLLVNYLCAPEVETASRFMRNSELRAVLAAASPAAAAAATVDPTTGRLVTRPEPGKSPTDGLGALNILQAGFAPSTDPALKRLAADLLLQARRAGSGRR